MRKYGKFLRKRRTKMEYRTISPKEVRQYLGRNDVQVVDLRDKEAFQKLHLKGAISIPYEELKQKAYLLEKNSLIFLYCERGSISLKAAREMADSGYRTVTLIGGIFALQHRNFE